jgi:hypothetical protein
VESRRIADGVETAAYGTLRWSAAMGHHGSNRSETGHARLAIRPDDGDGNIRDLTVAARGELVREPLRLIVFVGLSDDRWLALVV